VLEERVLDHEALRWPHFPKSTSTIDAKYLTPARHAVRKLAG
jgi:hypothetical protein